MGAKTGTGGEWSKKDARRANAAPLALKQQQFQFNLKKIFLRGLRCLVFPMLFCRSDCPPHLGAGGSLKTRPSALRCNVQGPRSLSWDAPLRYTIHHPHSWIWRWTLHRRLPCLPQASVPFRGLHRRGGDGVPPPVRGRCTTFSISLRAIAAAASCVGRAGVGGLLLKGGWVNGGGGVPAPSGGEVLEAKEIFWFQLIGAKGARKNC